MDTADAAITGAAAVAAVAVAAVAAVAAAADAAKIEIPIRTSADAEVLYKLFKFLLFLSFLLRI